MDSLELEAAIALLLEKSTRCTVTEKVSLLDAMGRICAEDIVASFHMPPFDRSPLDGFTFLAQATESASPENPALFTIASEVCAGDLYAKEVHPGEAVRIMTGAPIPSGCDCVVRQEDVIVENGQLKVFQKLRHHQNYVFAGEDIKKGNVLIHQGEVLHAAHLGTLASMGYAVVPVYKKPRIAICSTGDELLDVGQSLSAGKIYNSNLYTLAARLKELGFEPLVLGIAGDDPVVVAGVIQKYISEVDLFLTTGGVSVGKKDIMHQVIPCLQAERLFWGVSMKPGTPVLAYLCGEKLGVALSGNPFAALATFELLVRPVLAKMAGDPGKSYRRILAQLEDDFPKDSKNRRFIRARFQDGKIFLPGANHSSGSLFSAVNCNALIDIPRGSKALQKGMQVNAVILWDENQRQI